MLRTGPRRALLLAFAAFFLLGAAWAVALPVNGSYDEKQHLVRAYAVWTGQWLPPHDTVDSTGYPAHRVTGPRSLLPTNPDCTWREAKPRPASCLEQIDDRTPADLPTTAGRYAPVYYLLVGLPLRISPDETGLVWARVLSAAVSALLLAFAVVLSRNVAAVALAATPLAMNLNGSINPNGLEISAGVLLFAALLAIRHRPERTTYAAAGVAAALLLTVRSLGPLLCGLVVVAVAVVTPWSRLRAVLRDTGMWRWLAAPAGAGAAFWVYWTVASGIGEVEPVSARVKLTEPGAILADIVDARGEFWVRQIVAQFNYGETTVSVLMIAAWYLLVAAVVLPALRSGTRRDRTAIVGVALASVVLLVALELVYAPKVGPFAHGRYVMPLGVGVLLLAANAANAAKAANRFTLAILLATVPLDLYALARVMTRFQHGIDAGLNPFGGSWQPLYGSLPPLLACLAGALLLIPAAKATEATAAPHRQPAAAPT